MAELPDNPIPADAAWAVAFVLRLIDEHFHGEMTISFHDGRPRQVRECKTSVPPERPEAKQRIGRSEL